MPHTGSLDLLVPFSPEMLAAVRAWFVDPDVQQWLGGPSWPDVLLSLRQSGTAGHEYRGATVVGAKAFVLLDSCDTPVALVDTECYDRETRFVGHGEDGPVFDDVPGPHRPLAALSVVVDPDRRRQGFGRAAIQAVVAHPDLAMVDRFVAAIEPGNAGSQALFRAAGFWLLDPEPDWEGMLTYVRDRPSP